MRPRARSRGLSFMSGKSDSSNKAAKPKIDLTETAEEKHRSHMTQTTKANPNAAMNEAQPVAAQLEQSTLGSLRSIRHLDANGQPIADPDLSNPTRSRWERPLDTIKSFERAIDGQYRKRSSAVIGIDSHSDGHNGYASRRSSYYGGYDQNPNNSRYSHFGGYYGGRARESFADNGYGSSPMAGPSKNRFSQRVSSDPTLSRYNNGHVYPIHGHQSSRDTVNTGVSNGSQSEPWGNSTEPSSENSSIDRVNTAPKPEPAEQYGFSGYGAPPQFQGPIMEEGGYPSGPNGYYNQNHNGPPPAVPAHGASPPRARKVIQLGGESMPQPLGASSGNASYARPAVSQPAQSEKRKSWFKRRFSKG